MQDQLAKRILRSEMILAGVTYGELVRRLANRGRHESSASLRNKFSRGSFTADFFLHCLLALEVKSIRLSD